MHHILLNRVMNLVMLDNVDSFFFSGEGSNSLPTHIPFLKPSYHGYRDGVGRLTKKYEKKVSTLLMDLGVPI